MNHAIKGLVILILLLVSTSSLVASANAELDEAAKLIRQRDYVEAARRLQSLADRGNTEAQFRLAGLLRAGKAGDNNRHRATDLYREAARGGHAEAQYELALILEKSNDAAAMAEALMWMQEAAAQGHERAADKAGQIDRSPEIANEKANAADIFDAVVHNHSSRIETWIRQGVDLDITDEQGNSVVMVALLAGWPDLALILVRHSTVFDLANTEGRRPIHLASSRGYHKVVRALLSRKVDINRPDGRGNTPLMLAVKSRQSGVVNLLLDRGADHSLTNNKTQTALDIAHAIDDAASLGVLNRFGAKRTRSERLKSAGTLADFKASVRQHGKRYQGWPLLNIAIELGEDRIARQLVKSGGNLNAAGPDGNQALHIAIARDNLDIAGRLLSAGVSVNAVNKGNRTPLYLAVELGSSRATTLLLDRGADPAIVSDSGLAPLELAVLEGHGEVAEILLGHERGNRGIHRVLQMAVQRKMERLAVRLIPRDPDLGELDGEKRSLLWHSVDLELEDTSRKLLKSGKIDVNAVDVNGHSALSQAVIRGNASIVAMLVAAGADLRVRTRQGNTLLMLAVLSKSSAIVGFLLNRGLDADVQNNVGETALMIASAGAQDSIIRRLIDAGADVALRNNEELNAYQIALNSGHESTAKIIYDHSNLLFKIFN